MSTYTANNSADQIETKALLARYVDAINSHGVDSTEATKLLQAHQENEEFQSLARTVVFLRRKLDAGT